MKIALLGSTGYLGRAYVRAPAPVGLTIVPIQRSRLDYFDPMALRQLIRAEKIDGILNCTGFTGKPNVDACEDQRELCFRLNVLFPETLARVCSDENILLIQIGSGCIYQGAPCAQEPDSGFKEEDEPNFSFEHPPCSYYSGTKAEMEKRIGSLSGVSIWRIRMPFSSRRENRNLLTKLAEYPKVLEARNSLTDLDEMVILTLRMLAAGVPSSIYNLTNPGSVLSSEIVDLLLRFGIRKIPPSYFSTSQEIAAVMRAPRSSCVLDSSKIARMGFPLRDVNEALACAVQTMAKNS